jgi:hypothetical protein
VWVNGIPVVLTDWCACQPPSRLIDLDWRTFARIARQTAGVVRVTIRW